MKMAGALAALLAVACVLVPATSANAAPAQTNAIEIAYVPPKNSVHQSIYERLKNCRVLEKLQQLLSSFLLPTFAAGEGRRLRRRNQCGQRPRSR